jgi:hypothetical protein
MQISKQASGLALSIKSVKHHALDSADKRTIRLCDSFTPTDTVESCLQTLEGKVEAGYALTYLAGMAGMFSGAAVVLAGAAGGGMAGLVGTIGLGASLALGLAGWVRTKCFEGRYQALSKAARETADSLVTPGPQPGTYIDRRYYQGGVFSDASVVRSSQTGEALSKRVELRPSGDNLVVLEEDCASGQLSVHGKEGSRTAAGRLCLPLETMTLSILTSNASRSENWQTIATDGSSRLCFAAPGKLDPVNAKLSPTGPSSVGWSNGAVVADERFYKVEYALAPLVTPQHLGAPTEPAGELPDKSRCTPPGWIRGNYMTPESIGLGRAERIDYRGLYHDFQKPDFKLRRYGDGSLALITKQETRPLAAELEEDRDLVYLSGSLKVRQDLFSEGCRLSVETPQGRLVIEHDAKGLRAQRFWGDQPRGAVAVETREEGYILEGTEVKPIIPRALLGLESRS